MMKRIADIVERVVWWITRFILWCSVIMGPIMLIFVCLGLLGVPVPGSFTIKEVKITRQADFAYALLSIGLLTLAGYMYVLRYRRTIDTRRDVKFILVSCLLASLCIASSFETRHLRALISRAAAVDVQLSFVDADTGEPIRSVSTRYPDPEDLPEPFFSRLSMSSFGGEGIRFRFTGVTVPSIGYDYAFSAEGYETQIVSIAVGTETRVIQLKRIGSNKSVQATK
jgi:hypothetical protein